LTLAVAGSSAAWAAEPFAMNLENAQVGKLPAGWVEAKTGNAPGSVWRVVDDADAPGGKALAQVSDQGPNRLFNLCVAQHTSYTDVDLSVSIKAIAGKLDQGGGPVWRYQDAENYYIARMNPLENNYRVYKVVGGRRTQLATAEVEAAALRWHTLRVVQRGDHVRCYLGGKLHLEVHDDTFAGAGKIGLWTKADAQTRFAGLTARGE